MSKPGTTRLREFAGVTIVLLAALVTAIAVLLQREAVNELQALGEREQLRLTAGLASALTRPLAPLLTRGTFGPPPDEPRLLRAVDGLLAPVLASSNLRKIKVYEATGVVVYSTEPQEIGDDQSANEGVLAALAGEQVVDLERDHTFNQSDGEMIERSVLEIYVPLLSPDTGERLGVFESYADVTVLLGAMDRAERVVVVTASAGALVACLLLIALYRRTHLALSEAEAERQSYVEALHVAQDELEERVEARTRELHNSERRFRDIATAAGEYLWETDRDGRYMYVSERVADVLGYSPGELLGRRPVEFMPDEDAAFVTARLAQVPRHEPFRNIEHRSVAPDGELVWQSVSGIPVFDEAGELIGHRGTASDVTERRRSLEEVRKLSQAVEQSPSSIVVTDDEGVIEYVNPSFTRATGYAREEAVGQRPSMLQSGLTRPATYAELWQTIRSGATWRGEICNRRKDGTLYWDFVSVSPIKEADENISHYVAVQTDITQRKEYEESLRESEVRIRAVMNGVTDAIVTIDTSGTIEQCNPAVERLFGYEPEALIGQPVEALMPEPYRSNHHAYITTFLNATPPRQSMVFQREVEGLRRDGTRFPLELSVGEMRLASERLFVGVMRDLTERRRAEAELAATRQKYFHREKIAAVGQLATGILHEVGNPVSAIGGALEQLRLTLPEAHDDANGDEALATLDLIQGQVSRLEAISHDVGRVTSPHLDEWDLVDVNQLCRDAASLLRYDRRTTDVSIVLELDPEVPAAYGSADQLVQILLNVMLNAVHACHEVEREQPRVVLTTRVGSNRVELEVADNGVGMDPETLARACEAFFTTKPPDQGTGLGLSLCKSIVEEHGGELVIDSQLGMGTTVMVWLPMDDASAAEVR
jgi:nitrogen fixation negative regulator NifL